MKNQFHSANLAAALRKVGLLFKGQQKSGIDFCRNLASICSKMSNNGVNLHITTDQNSENVIQQWD
jgi:inhibitor of KinA sporulation pathway (predicted exonuclease)